MRKSSKRRRPKHWSTRLGQFMLFIAFYVWLFWLVVWSPLSGWFPFFSEPVSMLIMLPVLGAIAWITEEFRRK